jgi:hypothetical protein
METFTTALEQCLIGGVLNQRVFKLVRSLGRNASRIEQLRPASFFSAAYNSSSGIVATV